MHPNLTYSSMGSYVFLLTARLPLLLLFILLSLLLFALDGNNICSVAPSEGEVGENDGDFGENKEVKLLMNEYEEGLEAVAEVKLDVGTVMKEEVKKGVEGVEFLIARK